MYKQKADAFIRELVTNGDLHDLSKIEREGVRQGMSLETLSFCLLTNLSIICQKRPLVLQERGKGNKLGEILHIPTREAKKNLSIFQCVDAVDGYRDASCWCRVHRK